MTNSGNTTYICVSRSVEVLEKNIGSKITIVPTNRTDDVRFRVDSHRYKQKHYHKDTNTRDERDICSRGWIGEIWANAGRWR